LPEELKWHFVQETDEESWQFEQISELEPWKFAPPVISQSAPSG
jgi:hypothetical protein